MRVFVSQRPTTVIVILRDKRNLCDQYISSGYRCASLVERLQNFNILSRDKSQFNKKRHHLSVVHVMMSNVAGAVGKYGNLVATLLGTAIFEVLCVWNFWIKCRTSVYVRTEGIT